MRGVSPPRPPRVERGAADRLTSADYQAMVASCESDLRGRGRGWSNPGGVCVTTGSREPEPAPVNASAGDWVVKGTDGRRWAVPAEVFARSYRLAGRDGEA